MYFPCGRTQVLPEMIISSNVSEIVMDQITRTEESPHKSNSCLEKIKTREVIKNVRHYMLLIFKKKVTFTLRIILILCNAAKYEFPTRHI